jgi:hypothetical protein
MRDYTRKPNRFTFRLLYNDEAVYSSERDFDAPFPEEFNLSKLLDKKIHLKADDSVMNFLNYTNTFENSWESIELGEQISEIFRLILRNGTEQYLYNLNKSERTLSLGEMMSISDAEKKIKTEKDPTQEFISYKNNVDNWFNQKNNKYTFVIIDRRSLVRRDNGMFNDLKELNNKIDVLREKAQYGKITKEELDVLRSLEKNLQSNYYEREIFRYSISADDFSYNGTTFVPPIGVIWKDFNINFNSPNEDVRGSIEYHDISEFSSFSERAMNLRLRLQVMRNAHQEVEKMGDNIKTASIEKDIRKVESELMKAENVYFKGIRTLIKEYINMDSYENRFLYQRSKNNNYTVNSSEKEIIREAIMI